MKTILFKCKFKKCLELPTDRRPLFQICVFFKLEWFQIILKLMKNAIAKFEFSALAIENSAKKSNI